MGQTDEPKGGGVEPSSADQEAKPPAPTRPVAKDQRPTTRYYKALCKRTTDAKEQDLCQQWRMAEAAKKQAKWTQRQFWATVAEIGALALTVLFTGWAAIAAGRASKAASRSVAVAEDTAKHQLRAYVGIEEAQATRIETGQKVECIIRFRNFGQTPAYRLTAYHSLVVRPAQDHGEIENPDYPLGKDHKPPNEPLQPTAARKIELKSNALLSEIEFEALKRGAIVILLVGSISYTDIYGGHRFTRFAYKRSGVARGGLSPLSEGNEAT